MLHSYIMLLYDFYQLSTDGSSLHFQIW